MVANDMGRSQVDSDMLCVKYLILTFSIILVLTGMLSIAVGSTIQYVYTDYNSLLSYWYMSPASLLIAIGIIIFFVSAIGAIGAARESVLLVNTYTVSLFIIFLLEISAIFAAFAMQTTISGNLRDNFYNAIDEGYTANPSLQETIDAIQNGLQCCGVEGPNDWNQTLANGQEDLGVDLGDIYVPRSCCAKINPEDESCSLTYTHGCFEMLRGIALQGLKLVSGAAATIAVIEVIGMYLSYSLGKSMRKAKSKRLQRQYEIRTQMINSYEELTSASEPYMYEVKNPL